jgi:quinoprotein glucose dehydrogenase
MNRALIIFVFDRVTGKPLFDIEERFVPPSNVPGEAAWPTQPFPSIPPIARQSFTRDELTNVTPESRKECLGIIENATLGAMYQPQGLEKTVIFPGTNGGPNWGGASFDPRTNHLFVNSMDVGQVFRMLPAPEGNKVAYRPRGIPQGRFWDSNQLP